MGKPDLNRPISTDIASDEDKGKKRKNNHILKIGWSRREEKVEILVF